MGKPRAIKLVATHLGLYHRVFVSVGDDEGLSKYMTLPKFFQKWKTASNGTAYFKYTPTVNRREQDRDLFLRTSQIKDDLDPMIANHLRYETPWSRGYWCWRRTQLNVTLLVKVFCISVLLQSANLQTFSRLVKALPWLHFCSHNLNIVNSRHLGSDRLGPSRLYHAPLHWQTVPGRRQHLCVWPWAYRSCLDSAQSVIFAAAISNINFICSLSVTVCIKFSFKNTYVASDHTE